MIWETLAYCGINSATRRVWTHIHIPTFTLFQVLVTATTEPYGPRGGLQADVYAVIPFPQRLVTVSSRRARL